MLNYPYFKEHYELTATDLGNNLKAYDNIRKIWTGQGDDYTTVCLLNYPYFKEHYELTATDISKQQAPDADSKATQQINFTRNLEQAGNTIMFFIIEEGKKIILGFLQGKGKVW